MTELSAAPSRSVLTERFTRPGQEFELVERVVRGIPMRVYRGGPRSLRDVALASAAFGDRTFVVYGDERWTFAEHGRLAAGLAGCLREEYGLRAGDRVAVSMRNYPEWSPIFFAAQCLGLVVVPLNAWWTAAELRYAIADSGARLVVADAERAERLAPHLEELGSIPVIEVRGSASAVPARGVRRWDDVLASLDPAASWPDAEIDPDDDATIVYTSGTTGKPKGAVGTHRNHCTNLRNQQLGMAVAAAFRNGGEVPAPDPNAPQPGALCTFPLFHIAGLNGLCISALTGGKFVVQYKWNRAEARALIRREQVTAFSGVPLVVRQLIEDALAQPRDFSSLASIGSGGAPVPPELIRRIGTVFDNLVSPTNGYGLTETTSAVVSNAGSDYLVRPDSVGRCQPGADMRVVDPVSGADATDGEIGELWFRGPNVVRGYWNDPEATAAAFTDGWFHTGDLGRVVDGWVYVVDRTKDVIIRGGENIYCAEVEAVLFEHPAIEDAALIGVPHTSLGEEAVAVIVPRGGIDVTGEDVRRYVGERLAVFKVPARVVFRTEPLPRTPTGKILKRDLRSTVAGKGE